MKPLAKHTGSLHSDPRVPRAPGIERVTLTYDADSMMCWFYLAKGSRLPMHTHPESQNGIVMKGKLIFTKGGGETLHLSAGDAYYFAPNEPHGSEMLEDTELLECFSPSREDYKD
jgi:quercetin dioxygenase-like cupin family protein